MPSRQRLLRYLRWGVRVAQAALVLLVVYIFIGSQLAEGIVNPFELSATENLGLAMTIMMMVGLLISWSRKAGAWLTLAAYIIFCFAEGEVLLGLFPAFPALAAISLVPGIAVARRNDDLP